MCSCGHNHDHIDREQFDEAVKKFMNSISYSIDLDEEYQKIQNKKSNLSRSQRDTIVAIVEYKREHFSEDDSNQVNENN